MTVSNPMKSIRTWLVLLTGLTMLLVTSFGHAMVSTGMLAMDHMNDTSDTKVPSLSCQLLCGGMYSEKEKSLHQLSINNREPLPPLFNFSTAPVFYSYGLILSLFATSLRHKVPIYRLNQSLRM